MLIVVRKKIRRKRQRYLHNHQTLTGRDLGTMEHIVKETNSVISGVFLKSIVSKITPSKHSSVDKSL